MTVLTRRRAAATGVFAAGIALATACSAAGPSGAASGATPSVMSGSSSRTVAASTSAPGAMAGAATGPIHTVKDAKLGTIIVNSKGFTLYRFDADSNHPPASHCTGTCAALWTAAPAANAKTLKAVKGIDHKLIGSVDRAGGGGKQMTIAGWPVYTYTKDSKPGQTNGQGVDGTWWAVTPTGAKAGMSGSTTAPSGGGGGSGY